MIDLTDPTRTIGALVRASAAEVEAALGALATMPGTAPSGIHLLVRAAAHGRRYDFDRDPQTLARALTDYDGSPVYGPHRDTVTRQLILAQVKAALYGHAVDMRRVSAMLDVEDDPDVPGTLAVLEGLALVAGVLVEAPGSDAAHALARIDALIPTVPVGSEFGRLLPTFRQALLVARGQRTGSYHEAHTAARHAETLSASYRPDSAQWLRAELMRLAGEAMSAAQRGDVQAALRVVPQLENVVEQLPRDDPAARQLRVLLNQLNALGGGSTVPAVADVEDVGISPRERAARLFVVAMSECDLAGARRDAGLLASGVTRLRQVVELTDPDDPQRCAYLATLGRMECGLFQLAHRRADLDSARQHLETAVRLCGHPAHPLWSPAASALALAYRLSGRLADGRSWGVRSLRGNTWTVLLQETPEHATDGARHAVGDAIEVARWCLADRDAATAAVVLDAGRGLMLAATRVTAGVPERLTALGRADLAADWRRHGGHDGSGTGSDLRYRVLSALTGRDGTADPLEHGILDPPSLDEVRAALTSVDADALVYLLPADANGGGAAVLVPRHEAPYHLNLPGLTVQPGDPLHRHMSALAGRDLSVASKKPDATTVWRGALDRLCDWAWTSAMATVLGETARWRLGRPARLVLVPMGGLATVPWHAARDPSGRFAVEEATFSYAPSARILCDCAWRTTPVGSGGQLIVGDPTGDLPDARAEAMAIRDAYYPSATLLGADRDPDGMPAATPDAVLAWLRRTDTARGLLHLACHGALRPGSGHGSYLSLAGRAELSAQAVIEARHGAPIGLVVLAACTTGVAAGSYDEAFSVSTAFLAAGAATVFGSLWPVPSDATSLLMFMAHHYLSVEGRRPADALHEAQLWMLDPARRPPPQMPRHLAARVSLVNRNEISAWAAFTHMGW